MNFRKAKVYFEKKNSSIYIGDSVRQVFPGQVSEDESREEKVVLSFDGSGEQESTSEAIKEILAQYDQLPFHFIHTTDRDYYDEFMEGLEKRRDTEILSFSMGVPKLIQGADLAIADSSTVTLAEISVLSRVSILIPKAYTIGNHQVFSGKSYESQGASTLLYEEGLTGEEFYTSIEGLLEDDQTR